MRWRQQPSKDSRKRDLAGRSAALERELTAAQETEDALATAIALNNLGTMHADLEEWEPAYERFADAARQVPAEASLEERATPHGNAANAARRLHDWPNALRHALFVDAVAGQADDEGQRAVALAAVGLVRKALTADEFSTMLEAAIESLPEELRGFVRRDDFLNPTVVHGELPGRNDPCPCGSGKKYKHCCLKRTA